MKPLGQRQCKSLATNRKTGGRFKAWWEDDINNSKAFERERASR